MLTGSAVDALRCRYRKERGRLKMSRWSPQRSAKKYTTAFGLSVCKTNFAFGFEPSSLQGDGSTGMKYLASEKSIIIFWIITLL